MRKSVRGEKKRQGSKAARGEREKVNSENKRRPREEKSCQIRIPCSIGFSVACLSLCVLARGTELMERQRRREIESGILVSVELHEKVCSDSLPKQRQTLQYNLFLWIIKTTQRCTRQTVTKPTKKEKKARCGRVTEDDVTHE